MASRQTDVTLNIRARNTAIAEVEKTLKALNLSKDALAAFRAITDASSLSTDELKAKQKLLNEELKKLKDSSGVSSLKKLQDELSRVSKSLSESQKKLGDLRRAQVEQSKIAGPLTEKQTKSIERQSLELDRERASVNRLKEEYAALNRVIAQAPKNLDRIIPATIRGVGSASNKISAELSSRGQVGAPIIQNGSSNIAQLAAAERKIAIDARRASLQQAQFVGAVVKPGFSRFASAERGVAAQVAEQQKQESAARAIFGYTSKISTVEKQRLPILSRLLGIFGQINAAQTKELSTQQKITAEHRKTSNAQKTGLAARLDAQRSSLDFYQRLRGQVLSLLSAYVGLYGVVNQVSQAFDDQRRLVGIESKLSVLLDATDATKIGDKLKFIQGEANRLGLDFLTLADNYSSFAISAKLTGASLDEIDLIFRKLSESARALNLNQVQTDLVFKATEQIFSKGKVYSEELRQQLGENLPGAFAAFAKSRKQAVADFVKDLGDGKIQAKEFISFIYEYAEANGKGLGEALQSSSAELARFKNQYVILRNEFEKQVDPAFAASLKEFTIALKDPATLESIKSIGLAAAETVKFIVEYRSEIGLLIKTISGFYAFKLAGKILKDIGSPLAALIKFFAGGVTTGGRFAATIARLGPLLTIAARAFGLLGLAIGAGAAGGGWLGNWLRDNSLAFEKFTNAVGVAFARLKTFSDYRNDRGSQAYKDAVAQIDAVEALNKQSIDARDGKSIAEKRAQDLKDAASSLKKAYDEARNAAIEASKATEGLSEQGAQKLLDGAKKLEDKLSAYRKLNPADDLSIKNSTDQIEILRNAGNNALQKLKDDATVSKTNFDSLTQSIKENNAALEEKLGETGLNTVDEKLKKVNKEYRDAIKNNEELRKKLLATKGISPSEKSNAIAEIDKGNAFALQTRNRELARIRKEENERQAQEAQALANRRLELAKTIADKEAQIEKDKSSEAARAASKLEINAEYDKLINNVKSAYKGENNQIAQLVVRIEKVRSAELQKVDSSLFDDFEKKAAERDRKIQRIQSKVEAGSIDPKRGQQQINQIYADARPELQKIADILKTLPGYTDELKDKVEDVLGATTKVATTFGVVKDTLQETAASGLTDAFFGWSDGINSAGDALKKFASDFFRFIAEAIVKQEALNFVKSLTGNGDSNSGSLGTFLNLAVSAFSGSPTGAPGSGVLQSIPQTSSGAPFFDFIGSGNTSSLINAGVRHDGGDVSGVGRSRRVDPSIFQSANARLGLGSNERAMILKTGEVVSSDREVAKRLGGIGSKANATPQNITVNNTVESSSIFTMGIRSRQGRLEVNNLIRADAPSIAKYIAPYLKNRG